jgi:hypothetical protein
MKTETIVAFIGIVILILLSGCTPGQGKHEAAQLSELQITACDTADSAETCVTKLSDLGIVSPEQCCDALGKCCGV